MTESLIINEVLTLVAKSVCKKMLWIWKEENPHAIQQAPLHYCRGVLEVHGELTAWLSSECRKNLFTH
jgi:hypothetical protein